MTMAGGTFGYLVVLFDISVQSSLEHLAVTGATPPSNGHEAIDI